MKKNKALKKILCILILIILFLIIQSTYSKYVKKDDKTTKFDISQWSILINGVNITETNDFSDTLNLEFDSDNSHVKNDVIVPTSIAHFQIEIDPNGTKLPFRYDVSIGNSSIDDFKIISYKIDSQDEEPVTSDMESVFGEITDTSVTHILTFYVQWYDKDSSLEEYNDLPEEDKDNLDNYGDVRASKSQTDISTKIPVNVKITQILEKNDISNTTV